MNESSLPDWLAGAGAAVTLLLFVFGIVLLILWIVLPFMIWSILSRLKRIHEDLYAKQVETNRLLAELHVPGQSPAQRRQESEATPKPLA